MNIHVEHCPQAKLCTEYFANIYIEAAYLLHICYRKYIPNNYIQNVHYKVAFDVFSLFRCTARRTQARVTLNSSNVVGSHWPRPSSVVKTHLPHLPFIVVALYYCHIYFYFYIPIRYNK